MLPQNERIIQAVTHIVVWFGYYGEVLSNFIFLNTDEIPTLAVYINRKCQVILKYNEKYIEQKTDKEIQFALLHEVFHIVLKHNSRQQGRDAMLSNIAQDMVINSIIKKHYGNKVEIIDGVLFPPKGYTGALIFENLYDWLLENDDPKNYSQGTFDKHLDDEISSDLSSSVVDNLLTQSKSSHSKDEEIEISLKNKRNNYIKSMLSNFIGYTKTKSWQKPSRKDIWGVKGYVKNSFKLNLVIDTSGSMNNTFKDVVNYLELNDVEYNIIQCDCEVKVIKKSTLRKSMIIKGGGYTRIQPTIDIIKKDFNKYDTIILTDGNIDVLDFSDYAKKVLILTTDKEVSYQNSNNVKQMKVDNI